MLHVGVTPNIYCYHALISSLRMPNLSCNGSSRLNCLATGDHPSRAADVIDIFAELKARGIVPDVKLYCATMQVLGRANHVNLCLKVLAEALDHHRQCMFSDLLLVADHQRTDLSTRFAYRLVYCRRCRYHVIAEFNVKAWLLAQSRLPAALSCRFLQP